MQAPPKISEAKEVPIEVLPPEANSRKRTEPQSNNDSPIHPLAAIVLIAVDAMWTVFDLAPPTWPVAIPLCFVAVFVPVFLIQRHLKADKPGRAAAFAAVLAVLAAIPMPIVGTEAGVGLLVWSGLGKMLRKALPGTQR